MAVRIPLGTSGARDDDPRGSVQCEFEHIWSDRAYLHRYCERIVGDAATAADIVQETYLRAIQNLDDLRSRPSVVPWLVTVARNLSLNELRRRSRHGTPVDTLPETASAPELDPAQVTAIRDQVRSALDELTPRERSLLLRQLFQGRSVEQLARDEHTSIGAVRSVLLRARTKVRESLLDTGARVVAPFAAAAAWARRHMDSAAIRAQYLNPTLPVSEVAGQVAAAALVLAVVAPSGVASAREGGYPTERLQVTSASARSSAPADVSDEARVDDRVGVGRRTSSVHEPTAVLAASAGPLGAAHDDETAVAPAAPDDEGVSPGGNGPVPVPIPAPAPPQSPYQFNPDDPVEEEPAEEPEDASYDDLAFAPGPDPAAPGHLFALGQPTGQCLTAECTVLFHSADGGRTWTNLRSQGLTATRILPAPAFPLDNRIYAMGSDGLQVSTDGGRHFTQVEAVRQNAPAAMSPGFSNGDERIYIGTTPTAIVYDAETDSTEPVPATGFVGTVSNVALPPDHVSTGHFFVGQEVGGLGQAAVFRCQRGDVCTQHAFLDGSIGSPEVMVSSTYASDGVVMAWKGKRLYRSSDRGVSFAQVARLDAGRFEDVIDDGRGNYYAAYLGLGPGDPGGVLRSEGGLDWTPVGIQSPLNVGAVRLSASAGGGIVGSRMRAAGGGLFCSGDSGANWAIRCP
jgi:RNA polymerase sigma-70 factor (ECF subfamily)